MTGRSARRRKRKAKAILEAAAAAEKGAESPKVAAADGASAAVPAVPSDRAHVLPGVRIRRREERRRRADGNNCSLSINADEEGDGELDKEDERALRAQLGFVPGNAVCVAARLSQDVGGRAGEPAAVKLYPLAVRESYRGGKSDGRAFKGRRRGGMRVEGREKEGKGEGGSRAWVLDASPAKTSKDDECNSSVVQDATLNSDANNPQQTDQPPPQQIIEPFPTLYWLASPALRSHISRIELSKTSGVPQMEQRLRAHPQHLAQMQRAHASYGRKRWELLTDDDRADVLKRGWKKALDERRGVAGINMEGGCDRVKCLHAHAAHYLAQIAEREEVREGAAEGEDEDDLNLVGKWTMEAVLESMKTS
ncbi:hypothetical protein ACHAXT_009213 [Thalassiosira profunda]